MAEVVGAQRSDLGPQRTLFAVSDAGRDALQAWLQQPVAHLRDYRSLLMLKLALLDRAGLDPQGLLDAQRGRLAVILAALEAKARRLAADST